MIRVKGKLETRLPKNYMTRIRFPAGTAEADSSTPHIVEMVRILPTRSRIGTSSHRDFACGPYFRTVISNPINLRKSNLNVIT
jgi:hypothetical protein